MPTAPVEIGFYDPAALMNSNDVVVHGTQLYVANGNHGLMVLDVSTPSSPVEIGIYDTPGEVEALVLDDGLVIIADDYAGMAVFRACNDMIFDDGFEALETTAWSSVTP